MRSTSLIGGAQAFTVLVTILRSKLIAVLVGPAGMGVAGLLTSSANLVSGLTNLGLGTSAVREVAVANSTNRPERISTVVTVLRRLVWGSGILGLLVMLALAPKLSQVAFGGTQYTFAFALLSVTLLLNQLSAGQMVVLQGTRKLQHMVKASAAGSAVGLLATAPLYYVLRVDGIAPAMIVSSAVALLFSWLYSRKVRIVALMVSREETIVEGKKMLGMGLVICLNGLVTQGASYVVRVFISNTGGVEQVGLYVAGFAIVSSYVGLIFTAMGTDYYPRLSEVAHDDGLFRTTVNQQVEIALLVLTPITSGFLVFSGWVTVLLYSSRFVPANGMIQWAALGMLLRAVGWATGMMFLAKNARRVFLWSESIANAYSVVLNILGYRLFGLTGLGCSFVVFYALYLAQILILTRVRYSFSFSRGAMRVLSIQGALAVASFLAGVLLTTPFSYLVGSVPVVLSGWFTFVELDRRVGLAAVIMELAGRWRW